MKYREIHLRAIKRILQCLQEPVTRDNRIRVSIAYLIVSGFLVIAGAGGQSALWWMYLYLPNEIPGGWGLLEFLRDLRTGISPLLATLEVIAYQQTGSLSFVTEFLYRLGLVLAYLIAVNLFSRTLLSLVVSSGLSFVFIWVTTLIHPQNAVVYDVFFPFFTLSYFCFLILGTRFGDKSWGISVSSALSGLSLTCLELTRPFILILLPLLILCSYRTLKRFGRKKLWLHFLPLLLLSGGWHAKLYFLQDGQILWSNHTGVNLWRAWGELVNRESGHLGFLDPSYNPEERANLNTQEQFEQSRAARNAVLAYVLRNPLAATGHSVKRLGVFFKPRTQIYEMRAPEHPILCLYRPAVWGSALFLFVQLTQMFWSWARSKDLGSLFVPSNAFLIFAASSIFILAVGESGEEARLLLSVLPFLASLPRRAAAP